MNAFHVSLKLTATQKGFLTFAFRKRGRLIRKNRIRFEVCWWTTQQRFVDNAGYQSMLKLAPDALTYLQRIISVLEKEDLVFLQNLLNSSAAHCKEAKE